MDAFADTTQLAKHAVHGKNGVVAAQNRKAATVGAEVLAAGGDAVDAAIATSFALAATEPWMSGLGGGATMLVYRAETGTTHAIDGGMVSPQALDPAAYKLSGDTAADLFAWPAVEGDINLKGPHSFAVPGGLAALGSGARDLRPDALGGARGPGPAARRRGSRDRLVCGTPGVDRGQGPARLCQQCCRLSA